MGLRRDLRRPARRGARPARLAHGRAHAQPPGRPAREPRRRRAAQRGQPARPRPRDALGPRRGAHGRSSARRRAPPTSRRCRRPSSTSTSTTSGSSSCGWSACAGSAATDAWTPSAPRATPPRRPTRWPRPPRAPAPTSTPTTPTRCSPGRDGWRASPTRPPRAAPGSIATGSTSWCRRRAGRRTRAWGGRRASTPPAASARLPSPWPPGPASWARGRWALGTLTWCPAHGWSSSAAASAGSPRRSSCASTASPTSRSSTRAPELGGTWFHNSYPGAACDVPSHLYSFSFAQRTRLVAAVLAAGRDPRLPAAASRATTASTGSSSPDAEVERLRAGTTTTAAGRSTSDDGRTLRGRRAHHRHRPAAPAGLPADRGARDLRRATRFHSAEWDHDYDLRGKRVAVIGTGRERRAVRPRDRRAGRRSSSSSSARATGSCRARTARTRGWFKARGPARPRRCRPLRRRFIFHYGESLTLMIRHPRTLGPHRRTCARRPSCAGSCATPELRAQGLAGLHVRLQARAVQLALPAGAAAPERRARHRRRSPAMTPTGVVTADGTRARGRLRHLRAPASRRTTSCSRWRSPAPAGASLREAWADGAARAPRHHGARASRRCS